MWRPSGELTSLTWATTILNWWGGLQKSSYWGTLDDSKPLSHFSKHPDFRPSLATVTKTALWIRLPELPIEYFDSEVLLKIGKTFGKPIQIYTWTGYARSFCENLRSKCSPWIRIGKHR